MPVSRQPSHLLHGGSSSSSSISSGSKISGTNTISGGNPNSNVTLPPGRGLAGGLLDPVPCTHIYAVALIALLAAAVLIRLASSTRRKTQRSLSFPSPSSPHWSSSLPWTSRVLAKRNSISRASSAHWGKSEIEGLGSRTLDDIHKSEEQDWLLTKELRRNKIPRRAGGFGEILTVAFQAQPQPQQRPQQQQHHQQPLQRALRHHRSVWVMDESRSRGVSANNGAGSDVHLSQRRSPAAAEKAPKEPYRVPPSPSFPSSGPQARDQPDGVPQEVSIMDGGDSWLRASALAAQIHPVDADVPLGAATASARTSAKASFAPLPSASVSADGDRLPSRARGSTGGGASSGSSPLSSDFATPPQFMTRSPLPPPLTPPSFAPAIFAFEHRRPEYAASIPPELEGSSARLSFIHQPNPDYLSASDPRSRSGSVSGPVLRTASPASSEFVATGTDAVSLSSPHSVSRRRSYNKIVPAATASAPVSIPGSSDGENAAALAQQPRSAASVTYSPSHIPHTFAPSSFPSTNTPLLPPPPPGGDEYGRDTTFFEQQHHHLPRHDQQEHGPHEEESLTHHEDEHQQQPRQIDVHGEIISVTDESGGGWKRHTRVYGGGVCLACLANGGGFYGANVPLEQRRRH